MQHVSASASSGDKRGRNSLKENPGGCFGKDFYGVRSAGALHTLKVYRTLDLTLSTLSGSLKNADRMKELRENETVKSRE